MKAYICTYMYMYTSEGDLCTYTYMYVHVPFLLPFQCIQAKDSRTKSLDQEQEQEQEQERQEQQQQQFARDPPD